MRRRQFITLLSGAVAWPFAARAQQRGKLPTIGFLGAATPAISSFWIAAFTQRLHELGWVEGRTVAIEYRWAEGRPDRFTEITAEFVRLKVDVIATYGTPAALAAKQVTSAVPVVVALMADPVATGLAKSVSQPGGNITGLSTQSNDTVGKRVEILRETVSGLRRLAIMAAGGSGAVLEMGEAQAIARKLGLDVSTSEIRKAEDIAPAFDALKGRADALYVVPDPLAGANRVRINTMAMGARLPTIYAAREYVEVGGLISYGANFPALFRRAADYVDKILRGGKPGDIPIEQPTKFDLVVNLTTAKALGLEIPATLLARADEVIE
jgi:putative tryptophan/tyrosine transport system substrate-binding protein